MTVSSPSKPKRPSRRKQPGLTLERRPGQQVMIGDALTVTVEGVDDARNVTLDFQSVSGAASRTVAVGGTLKAGPVMIAVISASGRRCRLTFVAPSHIRIDRSELRAADR